MAVPAALAGLVASVGPAVSAGLVASVELAVPAALAGLVASVELAGSAAWAAGIARPLCRLVADATAGSTIRNIVVVPHILIGTRQAVLAARRVAIR